MKVFVTGASGYIGGAIVRALLEGGHDVRGLVRSEEKAARVREAGARVVIGKLGEPDSYRKAAADCDAVIHAAFESPQAERTTAEALLGVLKGAGGEKAFVLTSGVLVLGDTGGGTPDESGSTEKPFPLVAWRPPIERFVLDQANEQLATAVIRPGFVYGGPSKSVLGRYAKTALETGAAQYIGAGKNHMAYVHRDDVAHLYRLVAEKRARGIFHGVDNSRVTCAELAAAVSRAAGKGGKTASVPLEEARKQMGPFADAFVVEQQVKTTRSPTLGWTPRHDTILGDVEAAVAQR